MRIDSLFAKIILFCLAVVLHKLAFAFWEAHESSKYDYELQSNHRKIVK